ncbi:MAG TPA: hypothetical protein VF719_05580, partial [Abditibacteriaceae bacterium]
MEFSQDALESGASIPIVPVGQLAGGAVTVDGDTGEWGAPTTWLLPSALLFQGSWAHTSGQSEWMVQKAAGQPQTGATAVNALGADAKPWDAAIMRLAFDPRNLYVAARVADSALVRAPDAAPLQTGDAIALGIDIRSLSGKGVDAMGGFFTDEYGHMHIRRCYGLTVAVPGADGTTRQAIFPPYLPIEGARVAARRIEGGYEVEASLPLQSLRDENGRAVNVNRFSSAIGVQFHVFDRDKPMPTLTSDALPPAPSYTWRRDSTRPNPAERNRAGIAWGVAQVREKAVKTEDEATGKVQLSNPQLENNRLWWRLVTWQPQGTSPLSETQRPFSWAHKGSAFDALTPGPNPSPNHSPLYQRSLNATQPEFEVGAPQTCDYPALGMKLSWRDAEAKTLAGGTIVLEAQSDSGLARRAYLVSNGGLGEFSTRLANDRPTPAQVKEWLQKAYWGWAITLPVAGETLKGDIFYNLWPQDARRGAALSFMMNSPEKLALSLRIDLRAAGGDEKSPLIWSTELPLHAMLTSFEIPQAAVPAGRYRMTAQLQELKDGVLVPLAANVSPKEIEIVAPAVKPAAPAAVATDVTWKASVSDAPVMLKHTRSLGNPGRAAYPQLTGVDAMARGVKDMQLFEGRLFTGDGDTQHNRGPSRIWSIQPNANGKEATTWRQDFSVPEEGIEKFSVVQIGDKQGLVVPGVDPADGLGQGKE